MLDLVQTLCELVAIPSVNPMGQAVAGPEYYEGRLTDYLEQLFRRLGVVYQRQTVEAGRDNLFARLDGDPACGNAMGGQPPLILFDAHQDTVPVQGMTIEPWTPTIRDGRIYGRGACDIKGGMAAMLVAFARLAETRPAGMPTVVFSATVNEEHGFTGARALAQIWQTPGPVFSQPPSLAIVSEPTQLSVVVAHKGVVRWRVHAHGRAAHSSTPERGDNAIFRIAPVLAALEHYGRDLVPALGKHPRCGGPTLNVGTIHGGLSGNTVPDRATIEVERRVLPGEDPSAAYEHARAFLRQQFPDETNIEIAPPHFSTSGLSDLANGALAAQMLRAARQVAPAAELIGVPYGTNGSLFSAAGVPTVVFGPGSIAQAHTIDEWVAIEQLERAADAYYRFAAEYDGCV